MRHAGPDGRIIFVHKSIGQNTQLGRDQTIEEHMVIRMENRAVNMNEECLE